MRKPSAIAASLTESEHWNDLLLPLIEEMEMDAKESAINSIDMEELSRFQGKLDAMRYFKHAIEDLVSEHEAMNERRA